ncbi:hypothetical protein B0J14DRAFT_675373 [Halenospora varia]|nr:hypothetical protein B0J14DRAFT_675373 [Halenospora varia]
MPGGRPRKYADENAAKAADKLKAVERKAARKAAKHGSGAGAGDASCSADGGYRFILENTSQWTTAYRPLPSGSRSPSPLKDSSLSVSLPSPPPLAVNERNIAGLDAFGKLALEPTIEVLSKDDDRPLPPGTDIDPEEQGNHNSIYEADNFDSNRSGCLNRVFGGDFSDFGGDGGVDFSDDFQDQPGDLNSQEAIVDEAEQSSLIQDPSKATPDNTIGTPPVLSPARSSYNRDLSRSAQHLIQQLTQPHTCPHERHTLQLQNHLYRIRNHRHTSSECNRVDDLLQILDPTLPHNDYIPDVLSRNDIKIANRYTCLKTASAEPLMLSDELMQDHRFHKLFEGRENHSTKPQNVCLNLHTSSKLGRPPTRAFDIDSACGFTTSLGVFLNGLDWLIKPHRVIPSDKLQEIPTSWDAAAACSLAKGLESYSYAETTFQSQQRLLAIILQPQYLHDIWVKILQRVGEDVERYHLFQGCQLFLNSKNLKMQLSNSSWGRLATSWNNLWDATIDSSFIYGNRLWLDIGRQLTPPDHFLGNDVIDHAVYTPETYLWRRCCLNSYTQQRLLNRPKSHLQQAVYQSTAFYDTMSMTLTPSLVSTEHSDGLIYSQFYMKEKAIQNTGGGPKVSTRRLAKAYLASKVRACHSLKDARKRSFGVREEHRVSLELWSQVLPVLIQREQDDVLGSPSGVAEQPYFIIPSNTYFGVVYGQMNKFCLGFEYVLSQVNPQYTKWEQTQAAIIFLRSLQRSFSTSMVQQEPILWKDQWRRQIAPDTPATTHQGLNIGALSARTGFGWFSPLFDWSRWTLKDHSSNAGGENMIVFLG